MLLKFKVNDEKYCIEVEATETLLHILRERLNLTGTKEGCGKGDCGACTVLLNGIAVNSCIVPAVQLQDSEIITIEGLAKDGEMSLLQKMFIEKGAIQCGFCTPGMIMSAEALLRKNPNPTREEIEIAIAGNLCRCTGYVKIIEAIEAAVTQKVKKSISQEVYKS